MKKLITVIVISFVMLLCATSVYAEVIGGNCGDMGDNVTWSLDTETCTLTISGQGRMTDFTEMEYAGAANIPVGPPWARFSWSTPQISSVIIEDGVTYLGSRTFYYCTGIESITIPDSVTDLGGIGLAAANPFFSDPDIWENGELYFGRVLYAVQGDLPETYIVKDRTTAIVAGFNSQTLKKVVLPDGLEKIGDFAFYGCTSLSDINFPTSLKYIGSYAFKGCTSLAEISLPASLDLIGSDAFANCTNLEKVTFSGSAYFGHHAFDDCENLTEFNFDVTTADFDVYIGKNKYTDSDYPMLVLGKTLYLPLTYSNIRCLGMENTWENGELRIFHDIQNGYYNDYQLTESASATAPAGTYRVSTAICPVYIDDRYLRNFVYEYPYISYPMFIYNDIVYYPISYFNTTQECNDYELWITTRWDEDGALHIYKSSQVWLTNSIAAASRGL